MPSGSTVSTIGTAALAGLTLLGAVYTLAKLGQRIVLLMLRPATFDLKQALVLTANVFLSSLLLPYGALELQRRRTGQRA